MKTSQLPRNLTAMIAESQQALETWDSSPADEVGPDCDPAVEFEFDKSMREFMQRLAAGEFTPIEYWEAVANDCEEDGDWRGAKSAYKEALTHVADSVDRGKILGGLAATSRILREDDEALRYLRAQVENAESIDMGVTLRHQLAALCWQLLRMNQSVEARKHVNHGYISWRKDCEQGSLQDPHSMAALVTVDAACDVAEGLIESGKEKLSTAHKWFDLMYQGLSESGIADTASGYYYDLSRWWRTQAKLCRCQQDPEGELAALREYVTAIRKTAIPCGYRQPYVDVALWHALNDLAEACKRNHSDLEASTAQAEATTLQQKYRLDS